MKILLKAIAIAIFLFHALVFSSHFLSQIIGFENDLFEKGFIFILMLGIAVSISNAFRQIWSVRIWMLILFAMIVAVVALYTIYLIYSDSFIAEIEFIIDAQQSLHDTYLIELTPLNKFMYAVIYTIPEALMIGFVFWLNGKLRHRSSTVTNP